MHAIPALAVSSIYQSIGANGSATFPSTSTGPQAVGFRMAYVDGCSYSGANVPNMRYQILLPPGGAGITASSPSTMTREKMAAGIPLADLECLKIYNDDGAAAKDIRVCFVALPTIL